MCAIRFVLLLSSCVIHSALAFRSSQLAVKRPLSVLRASLKPPNTFREMLGEMQRSVVAALEDNHQMLEVQVPSVGQKMFEDLSNTFMPQSVSVALAAELGQHIAETTKYKKVAVLHPQDVETMAAPKIKWKWPLVQECRDTIGNDTQLVICCARRLKALSELEGWLDEGFTMPYSDLGREQLVKNFTYDNITDYLEATKNVITSERRLILFNMDLDDVRDVLFKSQDIQFRFLSRAYPAYMMASYHVAASTDKHPFYTLRARGLLMRKHPSDYEFYLDHGQQQYTLMETFDKRPERVRLHRRLLSNIGAQGVHDVDTVKQRLSWWEKNTQFNVYRESSDFWRR